jgi:uncharacterized protein
MAGIWEEVPGGAGTLAVHVAPRGTGGAAGGPVVLLHGFPVEPDAARVIGGSFPALADRLAAESGRRVVTGCLRGVAPSEGDFSLGGWLEDVGALVEHAHGLGDGPLVRIVGFGAGGSLALCHSAGDPVVGGVACFGSTSSFSGWADDAAGVLAFARSVGVVRTPEYPGDVTSWASTFRGLEPLTAIAAVAPRPVLVVHGTGDDGVPVAEARALAAAGGPSAELRLVAGAGHRLRADPRAIALLVGWLERQGP